MDAKLNHSDLSSLLAKEAGITIAKAESFTKAMFDLVIEGLEQDGVVKINGLGTFKLTDVASRSSVNVNTGEKFEIKGHRKLTFTPADALKDNINQPFAMFEPVEVDETYSDDADEENNDSAIEENNLVEELLAEENEAVADEMTVAEETVVAETEIEEKVTEQAEQICEEEQQEAQAEELVEQSAVEQPKRPEPVMVYVHKKEKKTFAVPEQKSKKSYKWLYIVLSVLVLCAAIPVLWFTPIKHVEVVVNETIIGDAEQKADAVTAATIDATSCATPQEQELVAEETPVEVFAAEEKPIEASVAEEEPVVVPVVEKVKPEEYRFVATEELVSLDLANVTLADTAMYVMDGKLAEHKVAASETLTRIALKYYGDKKLWPYIVKYNSLASPDKLRKGMTLEIPMLFPKK